LNPKNRELYFLPDAKQDVSNAFAWYEEKSLGLGLEFIRCLEATIESIQRFPLMFPVVMDEYRRAIIRRFPYTVFYEIELSRTVIHAVFQCSQDPNKWKSRLTN
jgi:plasmid stabilization system protein ParE